MTARTRLPQALVVDDMSAHRDLYSSVLRAHGFAVQQAADAEQAMARIEVEVPDIVISDVRMPGDDGLMLVRRARARWPELPFLLVTAHATVRDAVAALKAGAVDYLAKPVDLDELVVAASDLAGITHPATVPEIDPALMEGIIAEDPDFRALLMSAVRVACSRACVLLTGPSGSGKEVVARLIHRASPRRDGPLIAINCAAIPGSLLAAELFGHERGAFTGAIATRSGRFREADGGSLFLDEIGELPLELQPILLRVLETGTVTPLGGRTERPVDARVIAATNRDLAAEVGAGRFRPDLFYRLNVFALELPPLSRRRADLLPLARHFLRGAGGSPSRLSAAAMRVIECYSWPGNVRELAHAIERARLLSGSDVILPEHLPPTVTQLKPTDEPAHTASLELDALERESILAALERTAGNRTRAAGLLGISRRTLLYKLKRMHDPR